MQSNRRLVFATSAVFTVAVSIFTGFFYLQAQANGGRYPEVPRPPDPMMSKEMVQKRIAKVHRLRAAWQPWARQHQYILYKMLHAQPEDHAALMAVWEELPPRGLNGLGEIPQQLLREGPARYTWQPSTKLSQNARPYKDTPEARARLEISKKALLPSIKGHFARWRDIEIAKSSNSGDTTYSLWASGRITSEKTAAKRTVTQVAPPYDFLR